MFMFLHIEFTSNCRPGKMSRPIHCSAFVYLSRETRLFRSGVSTWLQSYAKCVHQRSKANVIINVNVLFQVLMSAIMGYCTGLFCGR